MANGTIFSEYASRNPLTIDPTTISLASIADLLPLETSPGLAGTRFTIGGVAVLVHGRAMDIRAQILAALADSEGGYNYAPTLTSSGAGVLALIGGFIVQVLQTGGGTFVQVMGSFQFTRAVAGVAETITIGMPTAGLGVPPANFAAVADVTGGANMAGIHAATDFCGPLQAVIGAKTATVAVTDNAASSRVDVFFSYKF